MKMIRIILLAILPAISMAQPAPATLSGKISDSNGPLVGANIYWVGTTKGTVSAPDGTFSIERVADSKFLVISFTGYQTDTLDGTESDYLEVTLIKSVDIEEVEIVKRWKTTTFSLIDPMKAERMGEDELLKAACCNLSESFETNASVDVSFTDAITGTRQIRMLGLAGPYSQITRENIPDVRGLSAIYGMEYIPGTWIKSIQLNKGTGSVVNGFESIAGQINVELHKPESSDRVYLNLYANQESRLEGNLNLKQKINERLSTSLLLHGHMQQSEMDNNGDGFMDKPVGDMFTIANRWKLNTPNRLESQLGLKVTHNNKKGGQMGYSKNPTTDMWGMDMETNRIEGWFKLGKVFERNPMQSIGLQVSAVHHDQELSFGLKDYDAQQQSGYANVIFQSQENVYHTYKLGTSFQYDRFEEKLDSLNFDREEMVPGVFGEYAFSPNDYFDVVAGLRADYHNNFGLFFTPRLHVRFAIAENSVLRFSGGRGQRTASIIAENNSVLASSREVNIISGNTTKPYGLDEEIAWNYGANFTQNFRLDYREGYFTVDIYQTRFKNQVVVDLENPRQVSFYNLDGKSYSTSVQGQLDYELIRRLDVRVAYRWNDVRTTFQSGLKQKPMVSPHRAFMNLAYGTRNHWSFDYTVQWLSSRRIPSTMDNPIEYQLAEYSPGYFLMNAQISKRWAEKFDVYVGVENLLDFRQEDPILAASDPFGPYFDAALTWGPIFGRMVYAGIRLKIK